MIKVSLSRIYSFSAAHRLHSPRLSEGENRAVYDKCNNYYGHGHDYKVEVTVSGEPDEITGMILPLPELDGAVAEILNQLEHKHLNHEIPYFKEHITTGEVIIRFLWAEIGKRLPTGMLTRLKLWETNNNYFEIEEVKE